MISSSLRSSSNNGTVVSIPSMINSPKARLNRASVTLFEKLLKEDDIVNGDYNIHWLEKWLDSRPN